MDRRPLGRTGRLGRLSPHPFDLFTLQSQNQILARIVHNHSSFAGTTTCFPAAMPSQSEPSSFLSSAPAATPPHALGLRTFHAAASCGKVNRPLRVHADQPILAGERSS